MSEGMNEMTLRIEKWIVNQKEQGKLVDLKKMDRIFLSGKWKLRLWWKYSGIEMFTQ